MVNPDHFYQTMVDPEQDDDGDIFDHCSPVSAAIGEHNLNKSTMVEHSTMVDHGQPLSV